MRFTSPLRSTPEPSRSVAGRAARESGGGKAAANVMFIPCRQCALRPKAMFRPFSAAELRLVGRMKTDHIAVARNGEILREGEKARSVFTLYEGWAIRYKSLADGSRQILDFLLPGDTIGLGAVLLGSARHSVQAITPATFCVIAPAIVREMIGSHNALALDVFRARMEEEERADMRLALLGRLTGAQRVGYLMLEIYERLRERGMADGVATCPFPLHHMHLADALGLSRVHVTRTLKELRRRKLAEVQNGSLVIRNRDKLAAFSGYSRPPLATRALL